ncbi:MAG TPA: thiamine pyrophosphate-dependent enzyme [Methanomicrobiales archaeon]|nr:thiamine pyrophosphate-dependent enzyme [Methanomicrobiales archaeon]
MKGEEVLAKAIRRSADRFYTVPGHPVTGLARLLSAELVTNEKVGLEYALGDSLQDRRAAVVVKNVGLNACADPLVNATTQGLRAGVVVVAGDDLEAKGSQNVQDSRYYGELAQVPVLEPDGATCAAAVEEAFRASERFSRVAILRVTTPLLEGDCDPGLVDRENRTGSLADPELTMRGRTMAADMRTRELFRWSTESPLNRLGSRKGGSVGAAAGKGEGRIVTVYPPPAGADRLSGLTELGRPFLREHRFLEPPPDPGQPERFSTRGHFRTFCPSCPFKGVMATLKEKGLRAICDMGCSVLAMNPPYQVGVAAYGLGSSVAVAARSTGIALCGDFALLHSGVNALVDTYEKHLPLLCIVLANNRLGMTGGQPGYDPVPYIGWANPVIIPADHPDLSRHIRKGKGPRTVIVEGNCPEGETYETVACGNL